MGNYVHKNNLLEVVLSEDMPHAILLEGENLDKSFEFSKKLIKKLLCKNILGDMQTEEVICNKIEKGIHPDIFIIDCDGKSKTIGVNQIRDIKKTIYIKPNEALYKVYLIRNASALTIQSQNALLKMLEEPPGYVVFILMCKSSDVLLSTIISRVQKFDIKSENSNNSKAVVDAAQKVIEALLLKKEISIMESAADLVKDKIFFKDTVFYIIDILNKSILIKNFKELYIDSDSAEIIKKISTNMSEGKISRFIEAFKHVYFLMENNVNTNLIVSYVSLHGARLAIL